MKWWPVVVVPVAVLIGYWLCGPQCCERWLWSERLAAATRFAPVLGGAGILDHETGLVWETGQDPLDREWVIAREVCMDKRIGDRKGWRLPTFNELTSLVDSSRTNPVLPQGHPFTGVKNGLYWSATSSALIASPGTHAVAMDMALGDVSMVNKTILGSVKCVRGAMAGPTVY
ncbi:MAG: DUF1566 domain-containing protein [Gemmatimonadales bacterium]|nr:DUF1566 domain-containing protein [Gemmatimonadales bacterium]